MENENLLYFQDESGKEIGLYMINRFTFENKTYALLATPPEAEEEGVYVMRMEEEGEELSFAMPDDEEMEKLTPVIMQILEQMESECTHDCCSCHGCHHDEDACHCDDCDGEDK